MDTAKSLGLKGVNFYSWDYSRTKLVDVWNQIANFNWPPDNTPQPVLFNPVPKIFQALNSRQFASILDIYAKNAVLVTPRQTIQGDANIKAFYEQVIMTELKGGVFKVTSKTTKDNTIHYTWTCKAQTGSVTDGKDTIGIRNNTVIYHYCYYTIS